MALATRCPHCETVFKLDPHLLAPHDGRVRCGHCQEVFDAAHHRFELPDEPAAGGVAQHAAIIDDDAAVGPTTSSSANHDVPAHVTAPPDAPSKPRPFAPRNLEIGAAPRQANTDTDTERTVYAGNPAFLNASRQSRTPPPPGEPKPNDAANESSTLPSESARLKQFIRVGTPHPDAANSAQADHDAPLAEPPATPFVDPVDDRAEPFIGPVPQPDAPRAHPEPEAPATPAWREDAEPGFGARKPSPPARRTSANEAFPVIRESREAREARAPARAHARSGKLGRVVGVIVALLLVLLLLVQLAWWQRETVMVYVPGSHVFYSQICDQLGCTISPPRNIDGLQIESSGLRQVDGPHKLELKLSLRNRTDVALAFPALELTLLDDKNNVAIRRVLWPQDYARPGTIFAIGLAPQSAQPVIVRLDTGDAVAANYRVQVFYP
ncbi:FHA domain-containing protein [Caballeronia fortuita]|uniref:FHA domain-containing protein n=1 Tax=Caballeronia fortuita TaxID=1777138 RepID=A0A158BSQ7_9BURK|nr:zinc-ribbon and DUF3426 domain-containing protein [Caballeronia fortuita]SAK73030.1 FHA domain-containing protein [Caballeronia fortuita]